MTEPNDISRDGRYWYLVDNLHPVDDGESAVRLWSALPMSRPGQTVSDLALSPEPTAIYEDPLDGNRIAYWELRDLPEDGPLVITVDFHIEAQEVRRKIDPTTIEPYDVDAAEYERFTRSEPWIEITPEIEAAAREAVAGETNAWLAAKRIFDFVLREMSYEFPDISQRGAAKSFARRKGDCGEYSVVFAALCRAVGIPARTVTCNWFTGYGHQWAEFLCPPHGWIPVDASVADALRTGGEALDGPENMRTFCENRAIPVDEPDWLFGNLYASRLVVFVGTNVEAGERTFLCMQPAGILATPESFEAVGCGDQVVHGGFYLFDEQRADWEFARAHAERQLAQAYFDAGLHDRAEAGFRLQLEDEPKNSLAWFHLGQIHMVRGALPAAREAFGHCIAGAFGSVQPVFTALGHLLKGNCHDLEGERAEAVAEYEAVIASGVDFQGVQEAARGYRDEPYRGDDA